MSYEWEEYILDACEPPQTDKRCCSKCGSRAGDLSAPMLATPDNLWICTECLAETEAKDAVNEVEGAVRAA